MIFFYIFAIMVLFVVGIVLFMRAIEETFEDAEYFKAGVYVLLSLAAFAGTVTLIVVT